MRKFASFFTSKQKTEWRILTWYFGWKKRWFLWQFLKSKSASLIQKHIFLSTFLAFSKLNAKISFIFYLKKKNRIKDSSLGFRLEETMVFVAILRIQIGFFDSKTRLLIYLFGLFEIERKNFFHFLLQKKKNRIKDSNSGFQSEESWFW